MKRSTIYTVVLALAAGCHAGPPMQEVAAGGLRVGLAITPDPPVPGDNRLLVRVAAAGGAPVEGAGVSLTWDMPAMGPMPEMKGSGVTRAQGGGRYDVTYSLPMLGDWSLTLTIAPSGEPPVTIRAKVSTARTGLTVLGASGGGAKLAPAATPGSPSLSLAPEQLQLLGVRFGEVERRPVTQTIRATGVVDVDETRLHDVTLRYAGWIRDLYVDKTGQTVSQGQALLTIYSPDLYSAQRDFLSATHVGSAVGDGLADVARERLRLYGFTDGQIAALGQRGEATATITVYAPASGVVLDKTAVAGMRVDAGTTLYRIGSLGTVWVVADVYEYQAPLVAVGLPAILTLPYSDMAPIEGSVDYVYPTLDSQARTLRVRVALRNPALSLKPGMYVDTEIRAPLGERLVVPPTAVLRAGLHSYAFVDRGGGELEPREVKLGPETSDGDWTVTAGLAAGERVVTAGNFLIDSDARLANALPRWSGPDSRPTGATGTQPGDP